MIPVHFPPQHARACQNPPQNPKHFRIRQPIFFHWLLKQMYKNVCQQKANSCACRNGKCNSRNVIACRSSDQVNQNNRSQHKHKNQQHVKQHIETKWQIFTPQLQSRIVDTIAFPEYRQSFYDINQYINTKLYDSHKTAAGHKCLKLPVKKFPPGSSRCIQRRT